MPIPKNPSDYLSQGNAVNRTVETVTNSINEITGPVGGLASDVNAFIQSNAGLGDEAEIQVAPGIVISAEYDDALKEIICSLLAGKGLKIPNIQVCLRISLNEIIGNTISGELQDALTELSNAMDDFLHHTQIDEILGRLNNTIAEITSIANMINFCAIPLVPRPIPNLLEDAMGSFLGAGQDIIDTIGRFKDVRQCGNLAAFSSEDFIGGLFAQFTDQFRQKQDRLEEIFENITEIDDVFIANAKGYINYWKTQIKGFKNVYADDDEPKSKKVKAAYKSNEDTVRETIASYKNPENDDVSNLRTFIRALHDNYNPISDEAIDTKRRLANLIDMEGEDFREMLFVLACLQEDDDTLQKIIDNSETGEELLSSISQYIVENTEKTQEEADILAENALLTFLLVMGYGTLTLSTLFNNLSSDGLVPSIENLIEKENNVVTIDMPGGSEFSSVTGEDIEELDDKLGAMVPLPTDNIREATTLATSLKSIHSSLAGYEVTAKDGTKYNNVFETFVSPGLLEKLQSVSNPNPKIVTYEPIHNYCGDVVGHKEIIEQESRERSSGSEPTELPPVANIGKMLTEEANERELETSRNKGNRNHAVNDISDLSSIEELNEGDMIFERSTGNLYIYDNGEASRITL